MNDQVLHNLLSDQADRADATLQTPAPPPPVLCFQVGWTMNSPVTRNVDPQLFTGGWYGFVEREIFPLLSRFPGSEICIRNPGGCLAGEDMQLDQLLNAKAAGLAWLFDDFVPAIRQVTAMGRKVHVYLGWTGGDRDFEKLGAHTKADDWLRRAERSLRPVFDAGAFPVLDVVGGLPLIHELSGLAIWTRARIGGCGIESRPRKDCPHWHTWPGIWTTDSWWRRSNPDLHPDMRDAAPDAMLRAARVIRMIETPPDGEDWAGYPRWCPPLVREIRADGHVPAVYHGYFRDRPQLTWSQFVAPPTPQPDPAPHTTTSNDPASRTGATV